MRRRPCPPNARACAAARSGRRAGFTLLETLVALAILAIALSAAFRAVGATALSAADLRERTLAEWVAQNRLAALRASELFPPLGRNEGSDAQGRSRFVWREDVRATPNPLFRRVDLTVFDRDGHKVLATLTGYAVKPLR